MNILITSVGKRVTLVQIFKKTLCVNNIDSKVFTTELNPKMSPAAIISDQCFKVSSVNSPSYISELLSICLANNIKIVIPTIDTELLLLAENKFRFIDKGISILVPDFSFVSVCRDKRKTSKLFSSFNIRTPNILNKNNPVYPMFAKPFDGSLSKDLYIIKDSSELTTQILNHPKLIFMEYIDNNIYKEYTVDMYYGKDNCLKCIVPRERVEIRSGEINKGYTRKNYILDFLKKRLTYIKGVIGCICLQLFYNEETKDIVGIEINPRFGGGYPLSYYANANFAQFIVDEYFNNVEIEYTETWLDNTLMLRYDKDLIIYDK